MSFKMSSYIPSSKLDEGIDKSIENATRYLNDALFLYQNMRYQSSILLSMLSYEETGKALLLMDYKKKKEGNHYEAMGKKVLQSQN